MSHKKKMVAFRLSEETIKKMDALGPRMVKGVGGWYNRTEILEKIVDRVYTDAFESLPLFPDK